MEEKDVSTHHINCILVLCEDFSVLLMHLMM